MSSFIDIASSLKSTAQNGLMEHVMEWIKTSHALKVGKFEENGEAFYVAFLKDNEGIDFESEDKFVEFIMEFARNGYLWITDNEPFEDSRIEWTYTSEGEIYGQHKSLSYLNNLNIWLPTNQSP